MSDIPVELSEEDVQGLVIAGHAYVTVEGGRRVIVLTERGNAWLKQWAEAKIAEKEDA